MKVSAQSPGISVVQETGVNISSQFTAISTQVNWIEGIYSADPVLDPTAVKFDELTYDEVLARHLKATDTTAMTLAMDNHATLICFALKDPENIVRVVCGEKIGTTVKEA